MKNIFLFYILFLFFCCKKEIIQINAGIVNSSLSYTDYDPNIILHPHYYYFELINSKWLSIRHYDFKQVIPYDNFEINYTTVIDTSQNMYYFHYNNPVMYKAKAYKKNDIITVVGKWTNNNSPNNIFFPSDTNWVSNEKEYIAFRVLQQNKTYRYGWMGIIVNDSTNDVIIDDYAYEK